MYHISIRWIFEYRQRMVRKYRSLGLSHSENVSRENVEKAIADIRKDLSQAEPSGRPNIARTTIRNKLFYKHQESSGSSATFSSEDEQAITSALTHSSCKFVIFTNFNMVLPN